MTNTPKYSEHIQQVNIYKHVYKMAKEAADLGGFKFLRWLSDTIQERAERELGEAAQKYQAERKRADKSK
jgi:penicillin V acylase-like amidase (Ntn superfamily)